jgi:hypothetical protein
MSIRDPLLASLEPELAIRCREDLHRSLRSPHPEASEWVELGMADWSTNLPPDDTDLVDATAGFAVRWVEGEGWVGGGGAA